MSSRENFDSWRMENETRIVEDLKAYLNIDTSNGQESKAFGFLTDLLSRYGFSTLVESYHPEVSAHQYTTLPVKMDGKNIRASLNSNTHIASKVLFNSHIDVVPASLTEDNQFDAKTCDGFVYGRGACDTKGNLFILLGAVQFLMACGRTPSYDVILDLVSEEEVGGNGTLSTILWGVNADLVVVFEPTDLCVFQGHRGCLTTELTIKGKSVHMGSTETGVSAILAATKIIGELQKLENTMLDEARRNPAFSVWDRPLQINIGEINGGEWPGSVPEICKIKFNTGFLPPTNIEQMEARLIRTINEWGKNNSEVSIDYDFHAGLRNEAYFTNSDDLHVMRLTNLAHSTHTGEAGPALGWRVSCDARHYAKIANLPTVIFGAGSLSDAHSAHEKVSVSDLFEGMYIISKFLS